MATDLSIDERLRIEFALRALNADFCHFLDHLETDRLVDLFTEDAIYTHGKRTSTGRAEIAALFAARNAPGTRTARHLQSGLRLHIASMESATGRSVCLTFAADEPPPIAPANPRLVADFIDEYRFCTDGRWRIGRRHIERIFVASRGDVPVGGAIQ